VQRGLELLVIDLDGLHAFERNLAGLAAVAFVLHQFLQLVACAADREALVVQQVADAADHQHLVVLVVAPVAAPLHRAQLRELLLPVAQHMRFHPTEFADLTDGEVAFDGDGRERLVGHVLH